MKISYNISEVSVLDPQILIGKIEATLKKQGYLVSDKTDNLIKFKDDNWTIRSKSKNFKRLDGGQFSFSFEDNSEVRLKLIYYNSFLFELTISVIIITAAIILSNYLIMIFLLPFFIQFFFRSEALKKESKELLMNILDKD